MIQAETWRAALRLMRHYGPEAAARAAMRAAEHFVRGDPDGMVTWQRVVDAIVALQSEQWADGETLH